MDIPEPAPGLVVRYAYLWADEYDRGQDDGSKDRPVAIILATENRGGRRLVVVLPITHTPPSNAQHAIEIPVETKRRLSLDDDRSWVVLTEVNVFRWPGPDIRAVPGRDPSTIAYGMLAGGFFRAVRDRFIALRNSGGLRQVAREE